MNTFTKYIITALAATTLVTTTAFAVGPQPIGDATATVETEPVRGSGDAADDPAIWYNAANPSQSIVIGNDKKGALDVYDLAGKRIQSFVGGFYGNVDVRGNTAIAYHGGFNVFSINPTTRVLTLTKTIKIGAGEGVCMYNSPTGKHYVFGITRPGKVSQVDVDTGKLVRSWTLGSEAEGCVVDDELGFLYVSQEDVAIWKYAAEPTSTTPRTQIDRPISQGGHFRPDTEGITLVDLGQGTGYIITSSQAGSDSLNSYLVWDRQTNAFIREFKVVAGSLADNCGRTDGVAALAANLGPAFPFGIFICQDNTNTTPFSGRQNFKFVPLERVVAVS